MNTVMSREKGVERHRTEGWIRLTERLFQVSALGIQPMQPNILTYRTTLRDGGPPTLYEAVEFERDTSLRQSFAQNVLCDDKNVAME